MGFSLNDFFKKSGLWTDLENIIDRIHKRLSKHSKYIVELKHNDELLLQCIHNLEKENNDLKERLKNIEEKIWNMSVKQRFIHQESQQQIEYRGPEKE